MERFIILTLPFDVEISKLCAILLHFICISTDHISSISKNIATPLEENTSTYSKKGVQ